MIRIAFTDSPNQMAHQYYLIACNVFAPKYDDARAEAFMRTLRFTYRD